MSCDGEYRQGRVVGEVRCWPAAEHRERVRAQTVDEHVEVTPGVAGGKPRVERVDLKLLLGIIQIADSNKLILDELGPENG